jgi:hypothetical protein
MKTEHTKFEYKVDDLEIISDFDFKQAGFIKSDIYFYTDKKPFKFYYFDCFKKNNKIYFKTVKETYSDIRNRTVLSFMDYVKYQTEQANKTYKTSEINSLDDIMEGVDTAIYPLIYSRIVKVYPEFII